MQVKDAPNLWALNIDPDAAAHGYRERAVGPYRDLLPPSAIASMEEQLAGACTVEIAVFDEFTRLLGDPSSSAQFDHIIFDTAPTGDTLRLLKLPAAWTQFVASNTTGTSCLGALSGLAGPIIFQSSQPTSPAPSTAEMVNGLIVITADLCPSIRLRRPKIK